MRGVGAGTTTVTVINAFGEDRIEVHVEAPVVGDTVTIGSDGAIVQTSDGVQLAFGPGQLGGATSVSLASVAHDALALPTPNADYLGFLSSFALPTPRSGLNRPLQIAAPVSACV